MEEEDNKILGNKALYFQKINQQVHIKTNTGAFYNGDILEVSAEFLTIKDLKIGPMVVFFMEIKRLEPYIPKEEGDNGG